MFSSAKTIAIAAFILVLIVAIAWIGITLRNRADEITTLTSQLSVQNEHTKQATDTANANAKAVQDLQKLFNATSKALAEKDALDIATASQISTLKSEVRHVKSTCVAVPVVVAVNGVRNMQTGSDPGATDTSGQSAGARKSPNLTATTQSPDAVNQAIANWIADLYAHDALCVNNLAQIKQLQEVAP